MDHQVGVPAYRAGEVAIVFRSKGEMADMQRCVFGTLEAAKDVHVDRVRTACSLDGREQILHGGAVEMTWNFQTANLCESGEVPCLYRIRFRVNAAYERDIKSVDKSGDRFVGFDHEHFDYRMGVTVVGGFCVNDLTVFVIDKFRFGQVQMQHAIFDAAFFDNASQRLHIL